MTDLPRAAQALIDSVHQLARTVREEGRDDLLPIVIALQEQADELAAAVPPDRGGVVQ